MCHPHLTHLICTFWKYWHEWISTVSFTATMSTDIPYYCYPELYSWTFQETNNQPTQHGNCNVSKPRKYTLQQNKNSFFFLSCSGRKKKKIQTTTNFFIELIYGKHKWRGLKCSSMVIYSTVWWQWKWSTSNFLKIKKVSISYMKTSFHNLPKVKKLVIQRILSSVYSRTVHLYTRIYPTNKCFRM